jgi:ribosomal protein S18 acetylase RimI-like enzyme
MDSDLLKYTELTSINDDLLLPWLDLLETSFPPTEKMLTSFHLGLLKRKAKGEASDHTLLAAVGDDGNLVGLLEYEVHRECEAAFMWYLAVVRELRCHGLGARIYHEAVRRLQPHNLKGMVFEVEIPEEAHDEDARAYAERRIAFYRRQGARVLTGIRYLQSVGSHLPTTPMHIMVHAFAPMDPRAALRFAKCVFEDAMEQIGEPGLE